jgi:5'(3')-deoxyribonucleotidase
MLLSSEGERWVDNPCGRTNRRSGMSMNIGIDLDGVCYDFTESLRTYLIEHRDFAKEALPDTTTWNFFEDDWNMDLETYLGLFADGVDAGVVFLHGPPHEGCVEVLEKLRADGHRLNIVTHRMSAGTKPVHNTIDWLQREGIPFDGLTFDSDKTVVNNDIFIEDNVDNFLSLEHAGVRSFIMDRPWNQYLDTKYRVYSWYEFYSRVDAINRLEGGTYEF